MRTEYQLSHRSTQIVEMCQPFIGKRGAVLDFGCGNGKIGAAIRDVTGVPVTGVDVVDYNETDLPVITYEGNRLPFQNKKFETSVAIFALHHCQDPESSVRELVRVTRGRLLIVEDNWDSSLQKLFLYFFEVISNRASSWQIPIPFNFKKPEAWIKLFKESGLRLEKRIDFRSSVPVLKHVFFVLQI